MHRFNQLLLLFSLSILPLWAETTEDTSSFLPALQKAGIWMIPIIVLALLGLTLIIERLIFYFKSKAWDNKLLHAHLSQVAQNSQAKYKEELEEELREATQVYINKMEKGMSLINGVGNLAPLMGFFGTVVGMIKAFAAIAAATTVNAKVVAVGIQIALITTAGGLAIAVPVLGFFHFFNHLVQKSYAYADDVISELTKGKTRLSDG